MVDLIKVYEAIDNAEQCIRKGDLSKASAKYKNALCMIGDSTGNSGSSEIANAISMLKQDLVTRIRELDILVEKQRKLDKSSTNVQNISLMMNSMILDTGSSLGGLDTARHSTSRSNDPFLSSIINKLQNSLISGIESELINSEVVEHIERHVTMTINQFSKELGLYEQKKFKDYDNKLENLVSENRKLSNQILKLKERWDSLVESAKRRQRQEV